MTDPPFWQPAFARAQFWRTALGTVVVFAVWYGVTRGLVLAYAFEIAPALGLDPRIGRGFAGTTAFFLTFLGFHLGLLVVLRPLHRRGYASLFGPAGRLDRRHFATGAGAMLALAAALYGLYGIERLVLPEGVAPPIRRALPLGTWALGLIPALAVILVQTMAEEVVFRGYLLQQLRARVRNPLVWAVLPSAIFGALHFDPATYGPVNAAAYVLNATVIGTLAALVTVRTGNLGAAAGLHFGNNASLVLVGIEGNLDGFSLYTLGMGLADGYTTYSILSQTAAYLVIFVLWWRWMARHRPIAKAPGPA